MNQTAEDTMALLAKDLFDKRQRLIQVSQPSRHLVDDSSAKALEAEYRLAEGEYLQAKAVFARAMKSDRRVS